MTPSARTIYIDNSSFFKNKIVYHGPRQILLNKNFTEILSREFENVLRKNLEVRKLLGSRGYMLIENC